MVRLVSSRIHRCYSRSGGQRSARNERLTDLVHLSACVLLLIKRNAEFFSTKLTSEIAEATGGLGEILFIAANLSDLQATINAHRMFYKWSKSNKKSITFFSTPTKVDAGISFIYIIGGLILAASTSSVARNIDQLAALYAAVASSVAIFLGSLMNVVLSLPSLDFKVPPPMARVQNMTVSFFLVGSWTRFYIAVTTAIVERNGYPAHPTMQLFSFAADGLIFCGAVTNFLRVMILLKNVQHWISDEAKGDSTRPQGGLLSWFKASRSNTEMSDYDSDMDDQIPDSEEDNRANSSSRRGGWSRI